MEFNQKNGNSIKKNLKHPLKYFEKQNRKSDLLRMSAKKIETILSNVIWNNGSMCLPLFPTFSVFNYSISA